MSALTAFLLGGLGGLVTLAVYDWVSAYRKRGRNV